MILIGFVGPARSGLTRRSFLGAAIGAVVATCSRGDDGRDGGPGESPATVPRPAAPPLASNPFSLGVASGDPLPGGVVLWTRLVPDPLATDGGMPDEPVDVRWMLATDDRMADVVASGVTTASPRHAHSLHVEVDGLDPDTTYHYRFDLGEHASPIGRTRTAPEPGSEVGSLRLAVASCQAYQSGYFGAYRHLVDEDVDAVCFVGDYIYELEASAEARTHGLDPPTDLAGFRALYGVYKSDPDLRAAHAAHPWIVTWDDHEVEDNYADLEPGAIGLAIDANAAATFPAKRAAAYRAYWEHMPLARHRKPEGPDLQLYRRFTWGQMATF
ncbi:MAG TPA: alkaline phosphatase D family protein, partial [Acidimicrobiales bacterium]